MELSKQTLAFLILSSSDKKPAPKSIGAGFAFWGHMVSAYLTAFQQIGGNCWVRRYYGE